MTPETKDGLIRIVVLIVTWVAVALCTYNTGYEHGRKAVLDILAPQIEGMLKDVKEQGKLIEELTNDLNKSSAVIESITHK